MNKTSKTSVVTHRNPSARVWVNDTLFIHVRMKQFVLNMQFIKQFFDSRLFVLY